MKSILETKYIEPNRPISKNEIKNLRKTFYKNYNISFTTAKHDKCGHFYYVKKNGKKENDIIKNNLHGNCSVCWKIYKTPKELKSDANHMIECYFKTFCNMDHNSDIDYNQLDLEKSFYDWLYYDNYKKLL